MLVLCPPRLFQPENLRIYFGAINSQRKKERVLLIFFIERRQVFGINF